MEKKNQIPKYPLLRFPEFTDEWKEVKLGEVAERIKKRNTGHITRVLTISAQYGLVEQEDFFSKRVSSVDLSNYFLVEKGEFAYNKSYSRGYPWGAIKRLDQYDAGVLSPLYIGFRLKHDRIDSDYLQQYFEGSQWHKKISLIAMEGARNHGLLNIAIQDFFNLLLRLPSLPEQRKIAALLSLIDERIEVQNAIIKEQEVAKTLLSKELLTPEDDWTEYAVQDCLTYEQPAKYIVKHTDYSSDSTLTPVLTANKGFILGYTSEQGIYQKGACIIFDDFTLDCKYVPFAFKVKSSAIKILQARKGFDIRFMFEVIKSLSLSPFAHKRHYISEVEPIKVLVPSLAKQERISRLFAALDERLDVERAYAERLKQQKAYLLRQMFI